MESENIETTEVLTHSWLHKVTPLSKYLAIILFIIMPFIGGWIGYTYAPEKMVEVERVVVRNILIDSADVKILSEISLGVFISQTMWSSGVDVRNDKKMVVYPWLPKLNEERFTEVSLPQGWVVSFSESESPESSKNIRFTDPELPGKSETDAMGSYVEFKFIRADSCAESFPLKNNPNYFNLNKDLSTSNLTFYDSGWDHDTMGGVPARTLCLDSGNRYDDTLLIHLNPIIEDNKQLLEDMLLSISSVMITKENMTGNRGHQN